ncbi:histidinol-phosphate transaminase [Leptothoe kymatousa]|uniref:Histidinol-phosphate aminotransferase n=1 Tax=Leptothoe kymatousa TAU-MAC 1615 TaxID=2364775 RepID=A0ABS5Y052_9CYAN|nr:histidinol-phosphate transaminase [Leptothoe kymatousa]MBT9310996.1 histidinol-phosphate transaminase [Leptothoe kymatousa TAU-MAC 1615]
MQYFCPIVQTLEGHKPSPYLPPGTSILKLNSNENPYPPSPNVMAALRTLEGDWLRRYPDPYAHTFCDVAASVLGVPANWLMVGNGCDDLLGLLFRACVNQERPIVYPIPTYGLYRTLAEQCSAPVIEISYPADHALPLDQLQQAQGALTLIASPNSPSGHQVPLFELRHLAESVPGILAIDEAYVDFGEGSALGLVHDYENVIILRTLSKGYSLAGLRFGFAIAQPQLLKGLFKLKDSYGVDAIAIHLAAAAMADQTYKNTCISHIKAERTQLTMALRQLGFQVNPSHGNFVLAQHTHAKTIHDTLRHQDIWVRHYHQPKLHTKLRITVGTPEQNQQLLKAMAEAIPPKN